MKQAFYNLIRNASQATPPGGKITIRSDLADYEVSVTVTDTGSGIPPEQMGHLFEPFHTTKEKGTRWVPFLLLRPENWISDRRHT